MSPDPELAELQELQRLMVETQRLGIAAARAARWSAALMILSLLQSVVLVWAVWQLSARWL